MERKNSRDVGQLEMKLESSHAKMPPSQRAKQFLPFDAVAGLRQALKMKEHEMGLITRKELSEETGESINETLCRMQTGDRVSVLYFKSEAGRDGFDHGDEEEGEMKLLMGTAVAVDTFSRTITVRSDDAEADIHGSTVEEVIKIDDIASIDLFEEDLK